MTAQSREQKLLNIIKELQEEIAALKVDRARRIRENVELIEDLRKYGDHTTDCYDKVYCYCGWTHRAKQLNTRSDYKRIK